jgi:hypothetical protein
MAQGFEVLKMLCPTGGWVIVEDDFDSIIWDDNQPQCTKAEFQFGFAKVDAWKAEQDAAKAHERAALLERLGITEEEARLLLGGN